MYTGLVVFQLFLAFTMPGYKQEGLPVPSLGYKTLTYNCNALASFYTTVVTAAALHWSGVFRLTDIIDNFGHLMTVAMICGFATSFGIYFITVARGEQIRMSGNFAYDVFMGAALNPRIGSVDLKMWAEVRIPWVLLFMIAVSGACKQYDVYGYVTPVSFSFSDDTSCDDAKEHGLHGLGDRPLHQCLFQGRRVHPTDVGHVSREVGFCQNMRLFRLTLGCRWGFMVIFWNFAGVPFVRWMLLSLSVPDCGFRHTVTLSSTWLPTIPPRIASLLSSTGHYIRHSWRPITFLTRPRHRKPISACKFKGRISRDGLFLSCRGAPSKIHDTFRPSTATDCLSVAGGSSVANRIIQPISCRA